MKVTGKFEVKMLPLEVNSSGLDGVSLGRMSIDKTFEGALTANSKGEMLTAMTPTQGSAGYVAIEQVSGTLEGKSGSFVLQHFGIMDGEYSRLELDVVPKSGTGELLGISGNMEILNEEGQHSYMFEYEIK